MGFDDAQSRLLTTRYPSGSEEFATYLRPMEGLVCQGGPQSKANYYTLLRLLEAYGNVTEMKVEKETGDRRMLLFTLWTFATLNYVYADVVTLFDKSVSTVLSQTALLGAAVLVE